MAASKTKRSAGLLLHREGHDGPEVLLVHPGGPFWAKKDEGAWSIPKGELSDGEDPLRCAQREFEEETGVLVAAATAGSFGALAPVKQAGGKVVHAWHARGDLDAAGIRSNLFSMEWPPRSGQTRDFPEIDRAEWFSFAVARRKILKGQLPLLDELERVLAAMLSELQ